MKASYVDRSRDDVPPGATDTLVVAQGLGREVAEDVGKHII
jgi:hypothetical protein